jgi:hypothetical protein
MNLRTVFEGYCSIVCFLSLSIMIFLLGKTLLNSYYYLSPETLYPPAYKTIEQEFKLPKFDIPEGCPDLLRETPEQRSAHKKRRYDYEIQSIQNQAAHQVRSSLVYLVLLLLSFFGHLLLAKKSNAKNT